MIWEYIIVNRKPTAHTFEHSLNVKEIEISPTWNNDDVT